MSADVIARHAMHAVASSAYPVGVALASLLGAELQPWVYVTAIVAAVISTSYTVWKWVREWRGHG